MRLHTRRPRSHSLPRWPVQRACQRTSHSRASDSFAGRHAVLAIVATSVIVGGAYAGASQKLNVLSALARGASLVSITRADLVVPEAPATPPRLFRWRVNDVEVLT